ncbi:MAG: hypothetical protein Kow0059_16880 [Candidatus Sumerlaeia bacterium]
MNFIFLSGRCHAPGWTARLWVLALCLCWVGAARALPPVSHSNAQPARVAVDDAGRIYVSDPAAGSVFVYDGTLGALGEIGGLDLPLGVAADSARNRLYVGDDERDRIEVFDLDGAFIETIAAGEVQMPNDLALDSAGNVYVADSLGNVVRVYSPDGAWLRNIGVGIVSFPASVVVSGSELYVADQINFKIRVFSLTGSQLRSFGAKIPGFGAFSPGSFVKLQSLAVDNYGYVHAGDCYMNNVQMLHPSTGAYKTVYGSYGTDPGGLNLPLDLAFVQEGVMVVANTRNHRVELISYPIVTAVEDWLIH